jgi:hypothetical protein
MSLSAGEVPARIQKEAMDTILDVLAFGPLLATTWHLGCSSFYTAYVEWLVDTFAASGAAD